MVSGMLLGLVGGAAACDSPDSTCQCVIDNESACLDDVAQKPMNQCLDIFRSSREDYYRDEYGARSFKSGCAEVCPGVCGSDEFSEEYSGACGG